MVITVRRKISTAEETIGELSIDGTLMCYTLEDQVRIDNPDTPQDEGKKVYGETAIPTGCYPVWLTPHGRITAAYNKRFADIGHDKGIYLANVPGFEGIMVHCGNTDKDTLGCILVGSKASEEKGRWFITETAQAYRKIYPQIQKAFRNNVKIVVEVINDFSKDGKGELRKLA